MSEHTADLASLRGADDLYALFDEQAPPATPVEAERMPEPYRHLLAHQSHMTVTLESFHRTRVVLEVLAERHHEPHYARKILLHHGETGAVVQFGIMQFDLGYASPALRAEILGLAKPLGRILAEHGVMTRIGTHGLLALEPDQEMRRSFALSRGWSGRVFGRLATIFWDDRPVVDLLEVVRPEQ
jgi:chorismate-pyruvate lyase